MLKKYLMIFLVSMVPLIELRGAVPIAVGMNLPLLPSYIICILGNMLPVPIIFFFARKREHCSCHFYKFFTYELTIMIMCIFLINIEHIFTTWHNNTQTSFVSKTLNTCPVKPIILITKNTMKKINRFIVFFSCISNILHV